MTARLIAVVPIIAGEVDLPLLAELAQRGPLALDIRALSAFRKARSWSHVAGRRWRKAWLT